MRKILNFFQTSVRNYDSLILAEDGTLIAFQTPRYSSDPGVSWYLVNPNNPTTLGHVEPEYSGEYEWWGGWSGFTGYYIRSDGTAMWADWATDEDVRNKLFRFLTYQDD